MSPRIVFGSSEVSLRSIMSCREFIHDFSKKAGRQELVVAARLRPIRTFLTLMSYLLSNPIVDCILWFPAP